MCFVVRGGGVPFRAAVWPVQRLVHGPGPPWWDLSRRSDIPVLTCSSRRLALLCIQLHDVPGRFGLAAAQPRFLEGR